jgi:uncharacterized protein
MIVLSSSKGQDFNPVISPLPPTLPVFLDLTHHLITRLRQYDPPSLSSLMDISQALAERTQVQFQNFAVTNPPENGKPAILAYSGEAFRRLDAASFLPADLDFAQHHLRILSGLYGVVRPLDLIQPHRLEMGYALPNEKGKTLYAFWSRLITDSLNKAIAQERHPMLINLASHEYAKVVEKNRVKVPWIDIQFKEEESGGLKNVAIHAKRARGMMAAFLIRNRVEHPEDIQQFSSDGYRYRPELSKDRQYVFTRPMP